MSMRRKPVGLLARIHLPDAVRAVCVSAGSAQQRRPEHEPLHLLPARFLDSLVADFANKNRHFRAGGESAIHGLDSVGHALAVAVPGLKHVEIEHRRIVHALPRRCSRDEW